MDRRTMFLCDKERFWNNRKCLPKTTESLITTILSIKLSMISMSIRQRFRFNHLDMLVDNIPIHLMKMDTKGYELPALKGAKSLVGNESLQAIILELNSSGVRYGLSDQETFTLLADNVFKPYHYDLFSRSLILKEDCNQHEYNTIS